MSTAIGILGIIALVASCYTFVQARRTYEALNDHNGIGDLKRQVAELVKDRDVRRAQELNSGELSWPFEVPDNVQPRVVDYSEETTR